MKDYVTNEEFLRAIINSLEDELMVIDRDYRIVEANKAVLTRHGKSSQEVIGKYCYYVSHGLCKRCRPPYHECPVETVWKTGKPAHVTHLHIYDVESEKQKRYLGIIASPVLDSQGKVIAVAELMRDITEAREMELKNAKLHQELQQKEKIRGELLSEILSIQEEERKRIARELHDETSQVLASLTANLEAANGMLPTNTYKIKALLKKARDLSVTLLDEMHRLIYELRPTLLDDLGLVAATRWLTGNNLEALGVTVNFKVIGKERRLPSQLETALFRVIQEAISNITKHAHARNASVILYFRKNLIRVSIKDDGKGFDVEEAISAKDRPRGLGLLNMKERVQLFNGSFCIHSKVGGGGTEIDIKIPTNREVSNG